MGNRISLQFQKDNEKSVVLFSHWGGMEFRDEARDYLRELKGEVKGKQCEPLERLEPNTVMVDFIRHLTKNMGRVESDLYLAKDENEGDNSDNGHFILDL